MGCRGSKSTDVAEPEYRSAASLLKKYEVDHGGSKSSTNKATAIKSAGTKLAAVQGLVGGETDFMETMKFANTVPLFKKLPKDQLPLLAKACTQVTFKPGQEIIREGDEGNEFFMIRTGEATVMVKHKTVATLKTGDFFGEAALLRDEPRTATVVALVALSALKITREKFQELGLNDKLHFANRRAVGASPDKAGGRKVGTKPPSKKTDEERLVMFKALGSNANLRTLQLSKAMGYEMVDVAWEEEVKAGTSLIEQGDMKADYFYIVKDGIFDILVTKTGKGVGKSVGSVKQGACFGELALLYLAPRAATVKCIEDAVVWVIDRNNFKQILLKKSKEKVAEHVKLLDRVELLSALSLEEKTKISGALVEVHFKQDEVILRQGDAGSAFYILFEGTVAIIKDDKEEVRLEACHSKQIAQIFGERALLNSSEGRRAATVQVVSPTAKVFALERDDFNALLGPLKDLLAKGAKDADDVQMGKQKVNKSQSNLKSKPDRSDRSDKSKSDRSDRSDKSKVSKAKGPAKAKAEKPAIRAKILRDELRVLGLLGCGGFGAVEMVEHKTTGESWALKAVSKGFIVQTGMKESILNEKMILTMTCSPFVISLVETYNSDQNVYFLLELALGGELYATYNRKGFHGREGHAKFYVAGVVYAFDHCHVRHIIYRDLKPENLLLTDTGNIKLTDMGLAKFVVGVTYTTCGTPDYFAPELVTSAGHTLAVDWWCLGVLLYEFMGGNPPFESAQPMQIYAKVIKGIDHVAFPAKCQGFVEPLIKGLLRQDPADRLAMLPGGIKNIQDHEWYSRFDWVAMEKQALEPPYKPTVSSKTDMKNFNANKEDMPPQVEYQDDRTGWDKDFATSV